MDTNNYREYKNKMEDLDLSKINHNENAGGLLDVNYTPINKFSKTTRPINFRSLSNLHLDDLSPSLYTPLTDRKANDISPIHVDLRLLEVT